MDENKLPFWQGIPKGDHVTLEYLKLTENDFSIGPSFRRKSEYLVIDHHGGDCQVVPEKTIPIQVLSIDGKPTPNTYMRIKDKAYNKILGAFYKSPPEDPFKDKQI